MNSQIETQIEIKTLEREIEHLKIERLELIKDAADLKYRIENNLKIQIEKNNKIISLLRGAK